MQPRDLIPAFMQALVDNGAGQIAMQLTNEYQQAYDWPVDFGGLFCDEETLDRIQLEYPDAASELTHDLFDALNDIAPDNHYFGAIEGDGSDYGFWENNDSY